MDHKELLKAADAYLDEHWEDIVADITKLVEIPSYEELEKAAPGAPYGPGPKAALEETLALAERLGMEAHDVDGYIGYADLPGATDTQLGIIGHVDVVPAGPGWTIEPFQVQRRDGYLLGRGTLDDKGPMVTALHAVKLLADLGVERPYTIRCLIGANEETGLMDVEYYRERFADPAFVLTPDAEFPVCYGEKGGFNGTITSAPVEDPQIVDFEGGVATNAVPGEAFAVVRASGATLPGTDRITVTEQDDGLVRIDAKGKSAHASMPETGVNAIGLVVDYLLDQGIGNDYERRFLEFLQKLLSRTDGSGVGLACSDVDFGPLTVIGGTITIDDEHRIVQTMDVRFPTSIDGEDITAAMLRLTEPLGATFENPLLLPPFLIDPDSPIIQSLLGAYREVTGDDRKPFTIGGGTYAREFNAGSSFGVEMPWLPQPEWVGAMHGPDEGIAEDVLKASFRIYLLALYELEQLDL